MQRLLLVVAVGVFLPSFSCLAGNPPDNPGLGDVAFTINAGGASQPISPLIYGINADTDERPSNPGNLRLGGNRWTGYNWENNFSNAGTDFMNFSDLFLVDFQGNQPPAGAVLPTLQEAGSLGAATNVTVPIAGFVAADGNGQVFANQAAPSPRWNALRARRTTNIGGQTVPVPVGDLSLTPDLNDGLVFTDEFVNAIESQRVNGQQVLYTLDNEPSLWDDTHPLLFGETPVTFNGLLQRTIEHASAIKDVAPDSTVLGGVTFGFTGQQSLTGGTNPGGFDGPPSDFFDEVPNPQGDVLNFNRFLLENIAAEEARQGRTLVDVLDLHWYPEAQGGGTRITFEGAFNNSPEVVAARVQAARSFFDPTFTEDSFITEFFTDGPIELLNRIQADIDELKPGTQISVSEYNFGGSNHISGAIAQADVLGVFGREGVFNASWFPLGEFDPNIDPSTDFAFTFAGFDAFTNFDGEGGRFGDLSVEAETDDLESTAIYASRSTENPNELVLVAINRTDASLDASIQIEDAQRYTSAEVFQITSDEAAPVLVETLSLDLLNAFLYELPAFSVSTIRLIAEEDIGLAGDYNGDGAVDAADFVTFRDSLGTTNDFIPGSRDPSLLGTPVGNGDFNFLVSNFGASSATPTASVGALVPEPNSALLVMSFVATLATRRGRWPSCPSRKVDLRSYSGS